MFLKCNKMCFNETLHNDISTGEQIFSNYLELIFTKNVLKSRFINNFSDLHVHSGYSKCSTKLVLLRNNLCLPSDCFVFMIFTFNNMRILSNSLVFKVCGAATRASNFTANIGNCFSLLFDLHTYSTLYYKKYTPSH